MALFGTIFLIVHYGYKAIRWVVESTWRLFAGLLVGGLVGIAVGALLGYGVVLLGFGSFFVGIIYSVDGLPGYLINFWGIVVVAWVYVRDFFLSGWT